MKFKAFREYNCFVNVTLKAKSWDDATDILWEGMLRPKQCFSEYKGVNVYYLAPFMIEQWHKGGHKALSKQYTVIADCYLRLVYEFEAEDAGMAKKIVNDYPSGVSEWWLEEDSYQNIEISASSTMKPLSAITITTVDEKGLPLEEQQLPAEDYQEVVMMIKDTAVKWINEGKEAASKDLQYFGSVVMTALMNPDKSKEAKQDALGILKIFNQRQKGALNSIIANLERLLEEEYK